MTPRGQSYLNLALCILLWATIPVASKKILAELSNLQMLFWSTIFSVFALGALVIAQRTVATLARYRLRDFARLSWLGLLGAFLYYILLYGAFARTSAAEGFIFEGFLYWPRSQTQFRQKTFKLIVGGILIQSSSKFVGSNTVNRSVS